jgi:hypothetical protein
MLYLGQVAVVNENLFSTSLPGLIQVKKAESEMAAYSLNPESVFPSTSPNNWGKQTRLSS